MLSENVCVKMCVLNSCWERTDMADIGQEINENVSANEILFLV